MASSDGKAIESARQEQERLAKILQGNLSGLSSINNTALIVQRAINHSLLTTVSHALGEEEPQYERETLDLTIQDVATGHPWVVDDAGLDDLNEAHKRLLAAIDRAESKGWRFSGVSW